MSGIFHSLAIKMLILLMDYYYYLAIEALINNSLTLYGMVLVATNYLFGTLNKKNIYNITRHVCVQ